MYIIGAYIYRYSTAISTSSVPAKNKDEFLDVSPKPFSAHQKRQITRPGPTEKKP